MPQGHTPFRFAAGALVAGKYRLVRQIGEGAMGVVWSVANETTGGLVALKLLVRPEADLRARMLREARAVCAIRHRNVLQVHDVGQTDAGDPFLVMELLTGETLADVLKRRRLLPPLEAAAVGRDVARALSAAHEQGVLHRDLKPANIFLHEEPGGEGHVVKVVDFGVSKSLLASDDVRTAPGGTIGSPPYMSPEQMQADPTIDGRTDIWSLGVVLFESLTGEKPFTGDAMTLFRKVLTEPVPRAARRIRRLDPRFDELVAACLRRPREERSWPASKLATQLAELAGEMGSSMPAVPEHARDEMSASSAAAHDKLPPPDTGPGDGLSGSPRGEGELAAAAAPVGSPLTLENAVSTTVPFAIGSPASLEVLGLEGRDSNETAPSGRRSSRMPWVLGGITVAVLGLAGVLVAIWPGARALEAGSVAPAVSLSDGTGASQDTASASPLNAPSLATSVAVVVSSGGPATGGATATAAAAVVAPPTSGSSGATTVSASPSAPAPVNTLPSGTKSGAPGSVTSAVVHPSSGKTSRPPTGGASCKCNTTPKPPCCKPYDPSEP